MDLYQTLTLAEALRQYNVLVFDRDNDIAPTSRLYGTAVRHLNNGQINWASQPDVQWASLRQEEEIGTVTTSNVYESDNLKNVSSHQLDRVLIEFMEGDALRTTSYRITPPEGFGEFAGGQGQICTIMNSRLLFPSPFEVTSKYIGGTIKIAIYRDPKKIDSDTPSDYKLECDIPQYVVYYAAAEGIASGYTHRDRFGEYMNKAAEYLETMKRRNGATRKTISRSWRPAGRNLNF